MKKRILSILLTICMLFCLTPISVFAEEVGTEGSAAIQLGADALSVLSKNVNTATAPTVYFGQNHDNNPAAWRVIGYDGSGVASSHGDITMLAANNMGLSKFGASNAYADSALKEAIDALADKLTAKETDAVEKRTLASGNYDGENTDGVAGPAVSNAVFWPLSSKEANAVNNDLRVVDPEHPGWASSYWWLRSPDEDDSTAYVAGRGEVRYYGGYSTSKEFGVRPAFDLNLDSVLFASAAVGGKPDGGLQPVSPNYTGNEWKLTLYDSKRNNFSRTTWEVSASTKGGTVEISYTDAKTGANEYISALIFDDVGNVIYYGRSNASLTEKDGTAQLTIPAGFAEGTYTLEVFNEQYNGDRKTDLASGFADVTLTVEKRVDEQFTLTPGGRYYFDLSAMDIPGTVNSTLDGGTQTDGTLHYVPFTYVGTVDAYSLDSAADTDTTSYEHSLFIANYNVTHFVSWDALDKQGLIFGKTYSSGSIDYTMRAPSAGTAYNGHYGESGIPANNEWDTILKKSGQDSEDNTTGYIKNWWPMASWGQDTWSNDTWSRTLRGYTSAHFCYGHPATGSIEDLGFRPVLEVPNPGSLGPDGLKAVTLDLGGGKLGGSTDTIQIIVKNGSKFTAPASDGLTRPDGNNGSYFKWLGSDGNLYAPGESVPEVVTTLTAQWTVNQYTITYDLAGGTVEGNPNTYTIETVAFTLKNPTKSGYTFTGWSGTGLDGENNMTVTIPTGSTGNRIYTAHWRYNGSGHSYSYYTIKTTAGAGGSISPSGNVSVREGRDQTFTITPDKGYAVAKVLIDSKNVGTVKSYTFENVKKSHTIEVVFMKANGNPQTGVFVDVATGSYYEDAVDWAVENGITKGTDDTHFSPDGICTRAQAVTFLWRTAGSPKPETRAMPFTDVPVGSYYYDAVLWAVENGITKGTSATTFSPNMTCSRAQIVAFLWRSEKSPAAGTANPFADVKSTAYYADAVLWAVKENITKGTTSTTFSPNADCTRAQIVTFLWRCKK